MAGSLWAIIGLSFIMKFLCPHSCLGSVYNRQLLFLNFSVGRTSFLHLDLKYAESPRPVNVLPALTPLPCIPNLHRFTCVTGTRRCPLKSLFGFCHFLIFCNLYLAFLCPLCFYFLPSVCVFLLFYLSICVAMADAHKVEQGQRVCPRLMVVLIQTLFAWAICIFSCWITRVNIFQWPEGVSSVNGCFNPNSVRLGNLHFFFLDHKGKYFSMARGCVLG